MKLKYVSLIFVFIAAITISCRVSEEKKNAADWVDVFIGTSNSRWMLGPYASVPFGMIQLGPDNQGKVWMSGYDYAINSISGFSHIHAWTMAGLRMMPTTTDLVFADRPVDAAYKGGGAGYHSRILKETEKAIPGYYSVRLYDHDVFAEMTATTRCGFQKYTFPEKKESRVLIDLLFPAEYQFSVVDAKIDKVTDSEIEGYAKCQIGRGSWNEYTLNFVLNFSKPFDTFNGWNEGELTKDTTGISGANDIGAYVTYQTEEGEVIMVKSGISLVSIDQARLNLETEMADFGWDFEAVKNQAYDDWNAILSKVEVEGGSDVDKTKFYTNLYRCFAAKQTWNDVNGKYMDPCEQVQQMPEGQRMIGGDSFWNSYWNLNSLWSLVTPGIMEDYLETQLELYRKNGWTSVGPTGLEYTGIMNVSHETEMIVGAYQKGIRNYDVNEAYQAVLHTVTEQGKRLLPCSGLAGNEYLDVYNEKGYVPYEMNPSSLTFDYAYDDYCVAQMAKSLGKNEDYKRLMKRSANWKNLFNPALKFMVPKDSTGNWMADYNPFSGVHFVEGNGWQYTLYVPHDIPGLIEMVGKDLFNERLEEGFEESVSSKFAAHAFDRYQPEPIEYYINMGNQVNMQAPYLFNYSGKPWLTQKYSRAILESYYGSTPYHGWEGDEDEGQMGAWFVMSAMGLFEMEGGCEVEPMVNITSPLFAKITVELDPKYYSGKEFTVEAKNNSKENVYIQSATWNGEPLNSTRIKFKDIVAGGTLILNMGPEPNEDWGIQSN
ncbi:GH92 family glycosyl hydrolase [Sunxiuqinia sp. A32]|uniref:GH92 family glycosyl hydrolase n=1 Tax=Sunxiuqinia sp. A32 TaxID=3461496 RepID=UPI00404595F0